MNVDLIFNKPKPYASRERPPIEGFHASSVLAMVKNYEATTRRKIDRDRVVTPISVPPILSLYNEKFHDGTPYEFTSKLISSDKNILKILENQVDYDDINLSHMSYREKHQYEALLPIDYAHEEPVGAILLPVDYGYNDDFFDLMLSNDSDNKQFPIENNKQLIDDHSSVNGSFGSTEYAHEEPVGAILLPVDDGYNDDFFDLMLFNNSDNKQFPTENNKQLIDDHSSVNGSFGSTESLVDTEYFHEMDYIEDDPIHSLNGPIMDCVPLISNKIKLMLKRVRLSNEEPLRFGYIECHFNEAFVEERARPPAQMCYAHQRNDIPLHGRIFCIEATLSQLESFFKTGSIGYNYFSTGAQSSKKLNNSSALIENFKPTHENFIYIVIKVCGNPSQIQITEYLQKKISRSLVFLELFNSIQIIDSSISSPLKGIIKEMFTSITTIDGLKDVLDDPSSTVNDALNNSIKSACGMLVAEVDLEDEISKINVPKKNDVLTTCKDEIKNCWTKIFNHKSDSPSFENCEYVSGPLYIESDAEDYSGKSKSNTRFRIELSEMKSPSSTIALQLQSESPLTFSSLRDTLVKINIIKK